MSKEYSHPFGKLASQYQKWRTELPTVVSNMARNEFVGNFKIQGYVNKNGVFIPWKPTKRKAQRKFTCE